MTSDTEAVNDQEGKLFVEPYCGPDHLLTYDRSGSEIIPFLVGGLDRCPTSTWGSYKGFTSTSVHFMWRLFTLWVHDSQDTSFNCFFITQLNSEIKVGRDIGHEKVIMQHRAAVMEGLGRDQGNWKPWTFHAPLVMGKCIIEVQQTFILKHILQFIIRLRCVSLRTKFWGFKGYTQLPLHKGLELRKKPRLWPALTVQPFALFASGLRPIPAFNIACEKIERISGPLSFIMF